MDSPRMKPEPKLVGYTPLKAVSIVSGQLPKYRRDNRKGARHTSTIDGTINGKAMANLYGISLIQVDCYSD